MNKIVEMILKYQRVKVIVLLLGLLLVSGRVMGQTPINPNPLVFEDFGGNTVSSTGSGDWWIKPDAANKPASSYITSAFPYAEEKEDVLSEYGQKALAFENIKYAFTKLSDPLMGHLAFQTGDHTFPDDNTKGYFVLFENHGNNQDDRTFYKYTIPNAPVGHKVVLSVWVKSMWEKTTIVLEGKSNTKTERKEFSINQENKWTQCEFSFSAIDGGDVDLSIIVNHVGSGSPNAAALDDITISVVPIKITAPSDALIGESVTLNASYSYSGLNNSLSYRWEKKIGDEGTWSPISGKEGTQTGSSFTTNLTTTETAIRTVYYRMLVSDDDFNSAIYSEEVAVRYSPYTYYFREDFGGNTKSSSGSGDWWIMPDASGSPTSGYVSPGFPYANDGGSGTYDPDYGLNEAQFYGDRYVYTKLSSPLPSWLTYHTDDHTFPNDNTKGYFALFENTDNKGNRVFYEVTIPSLPVGQEIMFSAWFKTLSGNTPFTLEAKDKDNNSLGKREFSVQEGGEWAQYELLFTLSNPGDVTLTITVGNYDGENFGAIDDISVTLFEPMVYITSPQTGAVFCKGEQISLTADYRINNTSSIYRWQFKKDGESNWETIEDATGTLDQQVGQISGSARATGSGLYRLQITESSDTDYADADVVTSLNIGDVAVTVTPLADIDYITNVKQSSYRLGNIVLEATVSSTITNPIVNWYDPSGNLLGIGLTNSISIATSGTYVYKVGLLYEGHCESFRDVVVNVIEESTVPHTFGGCGATDPFVTTGNNTYTIPGFGYAETAEDISKTPNMWEARFVITKTTQQDSGAGVGEDFKDITDHTGCDGYFLQVHASKATDQTLFYRNTKDVCGGTRVSFSAWIANISSNRDNVTRDLKFNFTVRYNTGETSVKTAEVTFNKRTAEWELCYFEFDVPAGASTAFFAITPAANESWGWGYAFAMDDINIAYVNPVQITNPTYSDITVLKGQSVSLNGEYKPSYECNPLAGTISFEWQKSTDKVTWELVDNDPSISFNATEDVAYYRLVASNGTSTRTSEYIKVTSIAIPDQTYWVCPDKITDGEATGRGYLPSLIYLRVNELYGITYKWYKQEADGSLTLLDDNDEYDIDQKATTSDDYDFVSDGKSSTISVQNERDIDGTFKDRTYLVEVCDLSGNAIDGIDKISIYLKQGYICGESVPVVSPASAKRLHRDNFGGLEENVPNPSQTPLLGMSYTHQTAFNSSDGVEQGNYVVVNELNGQGSGNAAGWYKGTKDHIYNLPNENSHGYFIAIDGNENPGTFYTHTISNLGACRDVELVFSGWLASPMNWQGYDKASLKFTLTNDKNAVLSEYVTGNLLDSDGHDEGDIKVATWRQYGFRFSVPTGVNAINLTITNNNFGTLGGNDIIMDDIEIYLVIPSVNMSPAHNSYVCREGESGLTGIITLEGEYVDDGTLGKLLDYRWEFSTDNENWTSLGAQDENHDPISAGYGSVTDGMLTNKQSEFHIPDFDSSQDGYYRLVVGQTGVFTDTPQYACMAVSESTKLTFAGSVAGAIKPSLQDNITSFCYSDAGEDGFITIQNRDANIGEYVTWSWEVNGEIVGTESDNRNSTKSGLKLKLADYKPGYHTILLTAFNAADCSKSSRHKILIYPKETTWIGKGEENNWNDLNNWDNGVPGSCTDVIIPNKSMSYEEGVDLLPHYPNLIQPVIETLNGDDYAKNQENLDSQQAGKNDNVFSLRPACNNILFNMGGSVARTDYLNYTSASVDLDIKPGRWYTLSAPLRAMYSGDYFVEGNVKRMKPTVFMMKYNTENPQTKEEAIAGQFSNPFNTLTEKLYSGLGFAVRVDEDGKKDELQPFRFPKDSTQYAMWNYHGIYLGKTSEELIDRYYIGRFAYEEHFTIKDNLPTETTTPFKVPVTDDKTMIVGNPFMGYLDFAKFIAANPKIDNGYYIWNGDTFDADLLSFSDTPNAIAPMQSFIVKKKENADAIENLTFDFSMSIPAPSSAVLLRSAATTRAIAPAILKLEVLRNNIVQSNIRIKYNPEEKNEYSAHKDMWTLFSKDITHPAVLYTLLNGKAASIRTLGDLSKPIELGIRTNTFGPLTFRISGTETLDSAYDIYLEDRLTGISHNLREEPEYAFNNETGNVQGRFYLRMGDAITGIEDIEPSEFDVQVVTNKKQIIITSSMKDQIELVKIYSLQGQLLYEQQSIGQSTHTIDMPLQNQMVIVMIKTSMYQKQEKIVVR